MKKIKRIIAVVVCVVLILTSAPLSSFVGLELPDGSSFIKLVNNITAFFCGFNTQVRAEDNIVSGTCGFLLNWTLDTNTGLLEVGENNPSYSLIMSNFENIAAPWQKYKSSIKHILVHNNVNKIGSWAFAGCENLVSFTMSSDTTVIGEYAFNNCFNLTDVYYNGSISEWCTIEFDFFSNPIAYTKNMYFNGEYLDDLILPEGIFRIGDFAFNNYEALKSVKILGELNFIGNYAFAGCDNLSNVTICKGVANFGIQSFDGCDSLKSINIDRCLSIRDYAFRECKALNEVSLINVDEIGNEVFWGCTNLENVKLDDIISIGDYVFWGCAIKNIVLPESLKYIGIAPFSSCPNLEKITIDKRNKHFMCDESGVLYTKDQTELISFPWGSKLTEYTISNKTEIIKQSAFSHTYVLAGIIFEESFWGMYNRPLKKLIVPDSLKCVEKLAFQCFRFSDIYYIGSKEQWNKINVAVGNEAFINTNYHFFVNANTEIFDIITKRLLSGYEIVFPVYALSSSGNEVAAEGAEVSIYIGADRIANTTVENGVASFKKSDFSSRYDIDYIKKNATVSAHLQLDNGLELCSEEVKDNGQWTGAKLSDVISGKEILVVDEPRWVVPSLRVMINESDVNLCKNVLKEYSSLFAQSTNGHVIVNDFEIVTVGDFYTTAKSENVARHARNFNIDICMVRNSSTGAWANPTDNNSYLQPGNKGSLRGGYGNSDKIIWCPINAASCAKTLCHESGHYLLGFGDEYASAIGIYETTMIEAGKVSEIYDSSIQTDFDKYFYTNKNSYGKTFNALYAYDNIVRDGIIQTNEHNAAYWINNGGSVDRPPCAATFNFGLMERQTDSIEMSRASYYLGIDVDDYKQYTLHYFTSQCSCEEKLEYELAQKAGSFGTDYTFAPHNQNASYSYAGGNNVKFTYDDRLKPASISLNSTVDLIQPQWYDGLCEINYSDSVWQVTADCEACVEIKDFSNRLLSYAELNENNGYAYSFDAENNTTYIITVTTNNDGKNYVNNYTLSTDKTITGLNLDEEVKTASLYGDTECDTALVYALNSGEISNGEYTSILGEHTILTKDGDDVWGCLNSDIAFNLPIDYSSMTWFYKTDGEWTALETSIGTAEHGEPTAACGYVGDGTYCLMAKSASDTVCSTPTELTVTNTDTIYDNDVNVTFTDSNENILHYNIYYGAEPITAENCENMNVYVADSTQATISLEDSKTTYYFAVQAVGNDGGKSEISECVSCTGALIDSDSDGLPDYWIDMYPMLAELDDIPGTDCDEDCLDNLKEYELGTDPLNPDTDDDNVYDGIEFINSLNPLEPMSDGETDDYYMVYGIPDPEISASSFAIVDDTVTCLIENKADGKAMRTNISIYDASGELLELNEVNLNSESSVTFEFSKDYLVDGMRIVIDEDQITRDNDYSNNEFVYSPATAISTTDSELTLLKSANEQLEFVCTPADATDIFSWESDDESVLTVDNNGNIVCNSIGEATVTVTTSLGYSCSYNILVEPFKGAGLTDFDCQLINDDSQVQIIGYVGDETSIVIPQSIGGIEVVSLSENAFLNLADLSSVTIHFGITSIGEDAFAGCSNLTDVYYDSSRYRFNQIDFGISNDTLLNADIHCSVIPTTAKNNTVLDDAAGLIYGLNAGIDSLEDYTNIELEGYYWEYTPARYGFGTGTTALLTNGETVMDGYTVVIFGDVNGDGWYDGEDAFLVNLIAKGMLDKDDVSEAIWTAADCNHDGEINEADVDLLTGAGLKLNDVDQTKTAAELATNSDYIEYVMLIDQSAGMNPGVSPDVDDSQQGTIDTNTTPEQPVDEINIEAIFTFIFDLIEKLINFIFSFVIK